VSHPGAARPPFGAYALFFVFTNKTLMATSCISDNFFTKIPSVVLVEVANGQTNKQNKAKKYNKT